MRSAEGGPLLVHEAALHDYVAIVGIADGSAHPEWVELDYLTNEEKLATTGFSRQWYETDPRCGPYPSGTQACDVLRPGFGGGS